MKRDTGSRRSSLWAAALWIACGFGGGLAAGLWVSGRGPAGGGLAARGPASSSCVSFLGTVRADLEDGDYAFFPNRRTVWVVNRTNGRMATYTFRDDEVGSVDRSRVAQIDLKAFPREDTVIQLSDRNLTSLLWVANVRTGDVQLWQPMADGSTLRADLPVATSMDLRTRE
ncbi:MAG: hypothetical protein ACUVYA_03070 [Planctomycetota bacterium]